MNAPDLTYHSKSSPFLSLSQLTYAQSKMGGQNIPVLQGEESNPQYFRMYNNFALNSGIASAVNIRISVYDSGSTASHTFATQPASQMWLHILENGFGENSVINPDRYTQYKGTDTPVGGNSVYYPEKGSDGDYGNPQIRAGTNYNGAGYIEFKTLVSIPDTTVGAYYPFVISAIYEWSA